MSGYVRIHRTLIGHPVFRNDAEAMLFAWLITQAQWRATRVRYRDHIICLQRGQLAISIRDLASRFDRDKAWVGRLLKRLQNEAMIETRGETGVSVITICNYGDYQSDAVLCETASEARGEPVARQVRDTEQGSEKGKKEKIAAPNWLPQSYGDFRTMRKQMRNVPFGPEADRRCIAKLDRLRAEGHDPEKLISKAIENGHRTFFPDDSTRAERAGTQLSAVELRERAEWFVRHGQRDRAEECRQKAVKLERGLAA